jgi:hypothetical protein
MHLTVERYPGSGKTSTLVAMAAIHVGGPVILTLPLTFIKLAERTNAMRSRVKAKVFMFYVGRWGWVTGDITLGHSTMNGVGERSRRDPSMPITGPSCSWV